MPQATDPHNGETTRLLESSILRAPLYMQGARWGSREVAEATGTSQSMVARIWRRSFLGSPVAGLPSEIVITGSWASDGHAAVVARAADAAPSPAIHDSAVLRSPRRCALQTMLAAVKLGDSSPETTQERIDPAVLESAGTESALVLSTLPRPADLPERYIYIELSRQHWFGLLPWLIRSAHRTPAGSLLDMQRTAIEWAANPRGPYVWVARDTHSTTTTSRASPGNVHLAVADQVFEWVVQRIRDGALTAGDSVTESSTARALHTTRNQTRDALRLLVTTGLLDQRGTRGVVVPAPTRADVFDTYAARRALGAEVLRRAISNAGVDIARIEAALRQVIDTAKTGDSYATGNADLHFQDVVAQCSGMRNVPQMMATLAKQLRVYIAVLGLGYVYPIDEMVADDTELARCIAMRDTAAALRAWDRKIDATLRFMTAHVSRAR
jgi:DNA-binding GntR family transcriptional regulator